MRDADDAIAEIAQAAEVRPDVNELVRCILAEFGGAPGLAKELHNCYIGSTAGANQVRILTSITKLVSICTVQDASSYASTEEIEAQLRALMDDEDTS